MKLITLNTWGGAVLDPLFEFVKEHKETDIFCLQEIFKDNQKENVPELFHIDRAVGDLFERIQVLLPEHQHHFASILRDAYGLVSAVKDGIEVVETGETTLFENPEFSVNDERDHDRKMLWIVICKDGKEYLIGNVHGYWDESGKGDTKERITQSERILATLKEKNLPTVLCGDFNLEPDTESVGMIEKAGFRNLVKEYGVTTTRTSFYKKDSKFADYIFVNDGIEVLDFKVMPDEVSDHSALTIEFK